MPFELAERLKALPTYLFVEIARKKREAIAAGKEVIDFGIGDPDQPTPSFIIERMQAAVADPANHRYPFDEGSGKFRDAIARFFEKRYGVSLDAATQIWSLIGSKEGLAHLPLAMINAGDVVITPEPGYPVYQSATVLAGGEPWTLPLKAENGWLPDLAAIPSDVASRAKLIYLNYPNNPTGAVATAAFYAEVVDFAKQNDIVIAQDAAYNEMYFAEPPLSILQTDGAADVAVEFHSASKTFNMTGWRVGFVCGNKDVVAAVGKTKSVIDSGVFSAVQEAAMTAYAGIDRPELKELQALYKERAETLVAGLREYGFTVDMPQATFYIWAGVPQGHDSMGLAKKLIEEVGVVCIPGAGFGPAGEGYVRFALTVPVEQIALAMKKMKDVRW